MNETDAARALAAHVVDAIVAEISAIEQLGNDPWPWLSPPRRERLIEVTLAAHGSFSLDAGEPPQPESEP